MREYSKITLLLFTLLIYTNVHAQQTESNFYQELEEAKQNVEPGSKEEKFTKRSEKLWAERLYPSGQMSAASNGVGKYLATFNTPINSEISSNWRCIDSEEGVSGNPFTGQIHSIKFHPCYDGTSNQIVYAASPYGGLFVSENNGNNWENLNTDTGLPIASVTDIIIHEDNPNTICVATGSGQGSINQFSAGNLGVSEPIFSAGVFRSDNAGRTWYGINDGLETLIEQGLRIGKMILIQTSKDILITTNFGIYKFDGTTWTQKHSLSGDYDAYGLEFQPETGYRIIYAASGDQIYKSEDWGNTWITEQVITTPSSNTGFHHLFLNRYPTLIDNGFQVKIDIAFPEGAEQNPNIFYVIAMCNLGKNGHTAYALFRHDLHMGWDIWQEVIGDETDNGFEIYHPSRIALKVDPKDENRIYFAHTKIKTILTSSSAGFVSQNSTSYSKDGLHADHHALEIHPDFPDIFWNGNDGGVSILNRNTTDTEFEITSSSSSTEKWIQKNTRLQVQLIWRFDDSEFREESYLVGYQDNGTNYHHSNGWSRIYGGDGFEAAIDDYNGKNRLYFGVNGGAKHLYKDDFPSSTSPSIFGGINPSTGSFEPYQTRATDILHHPTNGEAYLGGAGGLYIADPSDGFTQKTGEVHLWKDGNAKWAISSDAQYVYMIDRNLGTYNNLNLSINERTDSPGNYFNPEFAVSTSGMTGELWEENLPTKISANNFHALTTDIAEGDASNIVPEKPGGTHALDNHWFNNGAVLFMSFSGYNEDYKVWAYSPLVNKWRNMDPDNSLPNLPVNAVSYDHTSGLLFAGTDVGMYVFNPINNKWEEFGNFPRVRVMQIKINSTFRKMRVATYGRGLWETELPSTCQSLIVHTSPLSGWNSTYTANEIHSSSTVSNNTKLSYLATNSILLKPGFHAEGLSNSHVLAKISPFSCSFSTPVRDEVLAYGSCPSSGGGGDFRPEQANEIMNSKNIFSIYPNPSSTGEFNLEYQLSDLDENAQIRVIDLYGKVIMKKQMTSNRVRIDIPNQKHGVYLVELTVNNEIHLEKLIYQ